MVVICKIGSDLTVAWSNLQRCWPLRGDFGSKIELWGSSRGLVVSFRSWAPAAHPPESDMAAIRRMLLYVALDSSQGVRRASEGDDNSAGG